MISIRCCLSCKGFLATHSHLMIDAFRVGGRPARAGDMAQPGSGQVDGGVAVGEGADDTGLLFFVAQDLDETIRANVATSLPQAIAVASDAGVMSMGPRLMIVDQAPLPGLYTKVDVWYTHW